MLKSIQTPSQPPPAIARQFQLCCLTSCLVAAQQPAIAPQFVFVPSCAASAG
ncbi:hypothetical protein [Synechococcus elongatus]|uniref:Uncharacterized protein n=1 Tax=Synechococcus elongatus PCC 11802 TaxID=2283154 RepID=A0AAT9JU26_SYNEL|nr:hypothetical protein [Synechococcus elongatus]